MDAFVQARLKEAALTVSPPADRSVLIRRLHLDLIGLPPAPSEVAAFIADGRPEAFASRVDALLASPHYGERWGRHWLDVARYADSSGYEHDVPRQAWPYRDWVIRAFNTDLAFDQFVIEQLAGDLAPHRTTEQIIATAFHGNSMLDRNLPWEANIDRVTTTATAFLGLTIGCAQCHDHKTDPVSLVEFYQLYAFFNEAGTLDYDGIASPEERARHRDAQEKVAQAQRQLKERQDLLLSKTAEWEAGLTSERRTVLPSQVQTAIGTPAARRTEDQLAAIRDACLADDSQCRALEKTVEDLKKAVPALAAIPVLQAEPKETRVFVRGNVERLGNKVAPGVPAFLLSAGTANPSNRLEFARWLVSPENPLTARVTVNRIWRQYFGRGLVETENDFGMQTPPPTHPALLDWLAAEFMQSGWSWKHIHRLILNSATYQQSSRRRPELDRVDPENKWIGRQQRIRLEAEIVRDSALQVSGLLDSKIGGPSIFPYQPDGVLDHRATKAEWVLSPPGARHRRGMYIWYWRLTPYPFLTLFDAPDAVTTATRRTRSNTPVQALTLLNDPTFIECAQTLARRARTEGAANPEAGIRWTFHVCLGREPTEAERRLLRSLLEEHGREAGHERATPVTARPEDERREIAAWTAVARALLNLDEFVTRE